ncbi:MAG: hemolysin family protein [Halodesulfurarchaeum sp.]
MDQLEVAIRLLAGVGLILGNGYFVAIEFALTRARQFEETEFLEGGGRGLERAWEMTQDLELYLTTCQVGITATSIGVGIVAEPALSALFEPFFETTMVASIGAGGILAFLVINLVHLTHGEQTPTYLGVERSRFVARYGAIPLYWFHWLMSPVIVVGDGIAKLTLGLFGIEMTGAWLEEETIESREDLRARLEKLLVQGAVSEDRREEVLNALDVGERPIREELLPRSEIVALSTADSLETNLDRIEERPHTRYPLVGETLEEYVGIIYVPALLSNRSELEARDLDLSAVAAPPMTLSPDVDVSDAIDQLQTEKQELALVIEDGRVVGMVTVTDLLESVVGEFEDPLDLESES